jgi:hypothetical protein
MTAYEILIETGHSPAKAAQIVLDAQRGDFFSADWIRACKKLASPPRDIPGEDSFIAHGQEHEPAANPAEGGEEATASKEAALSAYTNGLAGPANGGDARTANTKPAPNQLTVKAGGVQIDHHDTVKS